MDGTARGPHRLTLADWPFGSAARRGLLTAVLVDRTPTAGWSTRDLERQAGVARGGLRHALTGAEAWGLIARDDTGRWRPPAHESDLAAPLRALLTAIVSSQSVAQSETLPSRRAHRREAILRRLTAGPTHVTELTALTGTSRATTYRELRALRDAGAVSIRRAVVTRTA